MFKYSSVPQFGTMHCTVCTWTSTGFKLKLWWHCALYTMYINQCQIFSTLWCISTHCRYSTWTTRSCTCTCTKCTLYINSLHLFIVAFAKVQIIFISSRTTRSTAVQPLNLLIYFRTPLAKFKISLHGIFSPYRIPRRSDTGISRHPTLYQRCCEFWFMILFSPSTGILEGVTWH